MTDVLTSGFRKEFLSLCGYWGRRFVWSSFILLAMEAVMAQPEVPKPEPPEEESRPKPEDQLKGLGFGVGLAFHWNVFKPDLINEAVIDDAGIVRVNERNNTSAGFLLEMHHFPFVSKTGKFGTGPFVAVQPGSNEVIASVGGGWMVGWKLPDLRGISGRAFALGFGYAAIPSAKTLGEEFVEGKPAPKKADGTALPLRYQNRDKGSILVVLSFVF